MSVLSQKRIKLEGKFCHGSVFVLDSSMVRASAREAGAPGQVPVQDRIFLFQFYVNTVVVG